MNYWLTSHREIAEMLRSMGYVHQRADDPTSNLGIAWSTRIGYDFTDLEFWPWINRAGVACVDAIVGHHASGTNPRLQIGCCETLAEIRDVHDVIRRLNGYPTAEAELHR